LKLALLEIHGGQPPEVASFERHLDRLVDNRRGALPVLETGVGLGEQRQIVRTPRFCAAPIQAIESRLDQLDSFGRPLEPAYPADQHVGPVPVVGEPALVAERHGCFGVRSHTGGVETELVKQASVCEGESLAVRVIETLCERNRTLGMGHRGILIA